MVNKSEPDLQSDIVADTRDYPEALQRLTMKGILMAGAIVVILIATLCLQKSELKAMLPFAGVILLLAGYDYFLLGTL